SVIKVAFARHHAEDVPPGARSEWSRKEKREDDGLRQYESHEPIIYNYSQQKRETEEDHAAEYKQQRVNQGATPRKPLPLETRNERQKQRRNKGEKEHRAETNRRMRQQNFAATDRQGKRKQSGGGSGSRPRTDGYQADSSMDRGNIGPNDIEDQFEPERPCL